MKVYGQENIPKKGGVIVAANHISLSDPPVLGSAMKRQAYYMAKEELFRIPIFGKILKKVNAFPVKRDKIDPSALKKASHLLKEGKLVILFPEGRRNLTSNLLRGKPGIGMLALENNVPVVPALLKNTNRLIYFSHLKVHFASPLYFSNSKDQKDYQKIVDRVMEKIAELKKISEKR